MVRVIWFHCFLSLCLAPFYGTWLLAVLAGGGMTCLATLLYKNASGALTTRLWLAAIFMGMSALIIQQSQGTIETHFGIFVLLAFLLYYRDWRPIVTAAGVIAVHHILFFFLQQVGLPIYIFNHHHGFLMVLMHAGYVVFETIILVIMAELARKEAIEAQEVAAFSTRVHSDGTINIRVDNATTTGQTSQNLRQLLSVIDSAVTRARSAADGIDQTSAHLSEIADQIRSSGDEQEQGTGQVATAAEQMSGIFASVARETSETADAARASEQEAVGGKEIVRGAVAEMESLASEVETAVRALEKLQEQSAQIGGIAKLIDGIAGQTNMLALNATIEAGRAGEAGRGFAIVADEVRALSKNTQTSVSKIDQMVQAVRLEISNVKQVLENCSARTVSALAQTKTVDKAFVDIVNRTSQITQRAQKVAGSVEEQGSATAEVTRGIKAIEKIARHNTSEAERLLETISTLEGLSRELNSSVDRFLTSDGVGSELTESHPVLQYQAETQEPVMHFAE